MSVPTTIQKLCESWWERIAEFTPEKHQRFAEQFLALHGWSSSRMVETRAAARQPGTISYLVSGEPDSVLMAHFVPPGKLEAPGAMVARRLDFCMTTRLLVVATRAQKIPYAFITDLYRSYLYDARTGELLLHADSVPQYLTEFGDVFHRDNVTAGSLDDVRRQPRSYAARQLREWMQRWHETLQVDRRVPEETGWLITDRLIVLRCLLEHGIVNRPGWRQAKGFATVLSQAAGATPEGCGTALVQLFRYLAAAWDADLFEPQPAFDAVFEQDDVSGPLLREFILLSPSKFNIATVLESFNYGEAAEKARVRMIPEENPERLSMLARQCAATIDDARIELDVSDEGYRAVFHWFDQLTNVYARLAAEFEIAQHHAAPGAPEDLDLFDWSEKEMARPSAFKDPFHHALSHGLAVYCTSPRQFRTARLMLYLHLIRRYQDGGIGFTQFPKVEHALQPRPAVLDTDRRYIYQAPTPITEWEAM